MIFILIIIPINTIINVINTAEYKFKLNSYFRKFILLNLYANSIKTLEKNSAVFEGKIDNGAYIWYVIIVINDDESIIKDRGTANILDIREVIFNIEKWYMLNGSTAISANILIDKNANSFIEIFFIKFVILLFVFILFIFLII